MKKIFILLFILCSLSTFSQDINLFGNSDTTRVSLSGSFKLGYQLLNDQNLSDNRAIEIGLSIGCILNENFAIGVYGYTNSDNLYNPYIPYNYSTIYGYQSRGGYFRYGYGGLFTEVRFFPVLPIHVNATFKGGVGSASYCDNNNLTIYDDNYQDIFYIIEPGAEVELNIVKFFKISGGVSYKFTDTINLTMTPDNILNGYTYNLCFNFIFPN